MDNNITIGGGNNSNYFTRNQIAQSQSINVGFEYLRYGMKVKAFTRIFNRYALFRSLYKT